MITFFVLSYVCTGLVLVIPILDEVQGTLLSVFTAVLLWPAVCIGLLLNSRAEKKFQAECFKFWRITSYCKGSKWQPNLNKIEWAIHHVPKRSTQQ